MNVRIAKKVVARFPVKPDRYNREQIEKAYRILDRPVDAHKMAVWEAAGEKVKADLEARKATVALRAERNAEKKAASKARIEGQRAARQAKKEAAVKAEKVKTEAKAQLAKLEAAKAEPDTPQEIVVKVGAVEAKIEAGEDKILGTDDDEVTLQKAGTDLASKSVAELKALCKTKGIKGYSKLKKDELLAALDGL